MKKTRLLASVMAAVMLILPSCGKSDGTVTVGGAGTGTPADTGGTGGGMELKSFREKLSGADLSDAAAVSECMAMYDALSSEEKAEVGYADFRRLADAEYAAVNGEILGNIDSRKAEVLVSVAKAYYNQSNLKADGKTGSPQVMYDEYNNRRNMFPAPEEATKQKKLYLDCSSYVGSVYYNTFGSSLISSGGAVNIKNLEKEWEAKSKDAFGDFRHYTESEVAEIKKDPEKLSFVIAEMKALLQPGDVICYRRNNGTGHVILYVGNGKIMHSTGSSNAKATDHTTDPRTSVEKDGIDEAKFGTVNIDDWDRFFTKTVTPKSQNDGRSSTTNSFIFADNVSEIVLLRPINPENGRVKDKKLTDAAKDHFIYEGIDIEKTAAVKRGDAQNTLYYGGSVYAGDEITFTVTVANPTGKEMKSITVTEALPASYEYVSSTEGSVYFADERTAAIHFSSIGAGSRVEFSYTVKVMSGVTPALLIRDDGTYVNHIAANPMLNQFSAVRIDSAKLGQAIGSACGKKADNDYEAISGIYAAYSAEGFSSLRTYTDSKNVIDKVLASHKYQSSAKIASRVLYGGYKVGYNEAAAVNKDQDAKTMNTRVRRVMVTSLEDGDIIVTYSQNLDRYESLMYYDGTMYGITSGGTFGKIPTATLSKGNTVQDYLDTLTAYNDFVILRPALQG